LRALFLLSSRAEPPAITRSRAVRGWRENRDVGRVAIACAALAVACFALPAGAAADRNLFVGTSGNPLRWEPKAAVDVANELGVHVFRIVDLWKPGETELDPDDADNLGQALTAALGLRVAVSVYSPLGKDAPKTPAARTTYCTYVKNLLARFPELNDIEIWVEPNKIQFWGPQFGPDEQATAPAEYEALLARCWDILHAYRPDVNIVAPGTSPHGNDDPHAISNISESPGNFIRRMGRAYRASGRRRPILDTVGHNAYGDTSAERPWKHHRYSRSIAEGDEDKLVQALWDGFHRTAQPIPGHCIAGKCVNIWYVEIGYQTMPDPDKAAEYTGRENDRHPVRAYTGGDPSGSHPSANSPAPDQATQILDGVRLAYCQPYVDAFFIFNLELWDDANLALWQSAAFWPDRTPKPSFPYFRQAIGEVNDHSVDCSALKGGPVGSVRPSRNALIGSLRFSRAGFRIRMREDAAYVARLVRVGSPSRLVRARRGLVHLGWPTTVAFDRDALSPGRYRIRLLLTSGENPERRSRLLGPTFTVG
jgi:hypothetical protein